MNRRAKRITRKKAVPLYFQRSHSSSSQFLATAQYKHQIKKLKKVNKELACSLQEAKCRTADQERALSECNRESTQMMFVKMKVKDIVETVQKLVTDLGEVYDVIDGKTFDFLKNCGASHQEARLQIRNPSFSTIEESASMSTIEPDLSKEESLSFESATEPARIELPATTVAIFDADSSQTEIYNVPLVLASEQKLPNVTNGEKSGVTTRSSKSLEKTNVITRSSKSLEKNGFSPIDQASPSTPQTPVFLPNFLPFKNSHSLEGITKLKHITSQSPVESQKLADLPKQQLSTSPSATKITPKVTTSKIPVKKLASSENHSRNLAVPSNHMDQRKAYNVEENVAEPHTSSQASDRRGTFVLDTLLGNAKSDIISDRRGTFVLNPSTYSAKPDAISDRRGTFVLNPSTYSAKPDAISDRRGTFVLNPSTYSANPDVISDRRGTFVLNSLDANDKPDPIFDRRTTYFISAQSEKQPDPSPPKPVETHNHFQNTTSNRTILLCEDMELTEIIPLQNQTHQFVTTVPPWIEKQENKESGSNEKLSASFENQFSCPTTLVKQVPVSTINSSEQFKVSATPAVSKDTQMKNTFDGKKDIDKSSVSNVSLETKMLAKAAVSEDRDPVNLQQLKNKEKDASKMLDKERNVNIKYPTKELPSPISHLAKTDMLTDMSIQHKIFESISVSEKNKQTSDTLLVVEGNDQKKSTISKDSLSDSQPAVDNAGISVQKNAESPKTRRSCRNQSAKLNVFFSDSEESDVDFDEDFIPEKRFSLKPGRKIINPNNKKVFVFKKKSIKQSTDKDIPDDSCSSKSPEEDIKDDIELDIFSFSTSSEADKSPIKKEKKRKSVMPKSNKRSVNRKSIVDPMLLKRKSKKSFKPEGNQAEVPVFAPPRKSILCLNNGPIPSTPAVQSNRKSVRFTLGGNAHPLELNNPKCDSPLPSSRKSVRFTLAREVSVGQINNPHCDSSGELNAAPVDQKSNDSEKEPSPIQSKRTSSRKKNSSAQVTGDITKRTSAKSEKSRKRLSGNLNLGSPENVHETESSPNKKFRVSNEIPQKIETCAGGEQVQKEDVEDHSHVMSGTVSSEVLEEKTTDTKKEKKSGGILSELNLDSNVKVSGSSNKVREKRPFSGVSERRSSKKEPAVDELFLDIDNAVSQIVGKRAEAPFELIGDEPMEEMTKFVEVDCNKGNSVKAKVSKQKKKSGKKGSTKKRKTGSEKSMDKENTPNNAENVKIDILTSDNNLGSKEPIEKVVKPKKSRKNDSASLVQKNLKTDVLSSENPSGSTDLINSRSRRNRPVMSFKEPSLTAKMRRE